MKTASILICTALLTVLLGSCPTPYTGDILLAERIIRVDIENRLFNVYGSPDSRTWLWGLGADKLTITVRTDAADFTHELRPSELDTSYDYTAVAIEVHGRLLEVELSAGGIRNYKAFIRDVPDPSYWEGWQTFANLTRFRAFPLIDGDSAAGSEIVLEAAPRGGVGLLSDTGAGDPDFVQTDRGHTLISGQIALQPQFREHPSGLEYYFYYTTVQEDLKSLYGVADNFDSGYFDDPWVDNWTVTEMTSTGRNVGVQNIRLIHSHTSPRDAMDPMGDGLRSILIDLTGRSNFDDLIGRYLVGGLVIHADGLQVASRMVCIEIR
ncbi:hypothetical protein [Spirochaeta dissipatitropha]